MMAKKEKKPVHHVQMTEGKRQIIQHLLQEYDIESAQDIQDALKDLLGGTIKEMMEAEMDEHPGYGKSERADREEVSDYRNGTKKKQVNSRYGSMTIDVPQDRESTFGPKVVKKRQKDISDIDQKIISMYAKRMTHPPDPQRHWKIYMVLRSQKVLFRTLQTRSCHRLKNGRIVRFTMSIRSCISTQSTTLSGRMV